MMSRSFQEGEAASLSSLIQRVKPALRPYVLPFLSRLLRTGACLIIFRSAALVDVVSRIIKQLVCGETGVKLLHVVERQGDTWHIAVRYLCTDGNILQILRTEPENTNKPATAHLWLIQTQDKHKHKTTNT